MGSSCLEFAPFLLLFCRFWEERGGAELAELAAPFCFPFWPFRLRDPPLLGFAPPAPLALAPKDTTITKFADYDIKLIDR